MGNRSWGAIAALILGILLLASSLTNPERATISGPVMILGAIAYMLAKQRGFSDRLSGLKVGIEVLCLIALLFLWLAQRGLGVAMVADPLPNLVIPLWALIAYTVAVFKARTRKRDREAEVYAVFGDSGN